MYFTQFLSDHGLKLLFILKILVIGYILVDQTDIISFGEKLLTAQDDSSQENSSSDGSTNRRKSFMDDLLTLPKINPDQRRKDELAKYFSIVERKSRQVEERIKFLNSKQEKLKLLEDSIDEKLKKLEEEISFFQQTQQSEKKIKEERLNSLVDFYKKMPAKKAAPVFEELDKDLVVSLFNSLPKKQTMNILSLMDPAKSVEISEYFGRIKSAKEYELLKEINTALLDEFQECKTNPGEPGQSK